MKLLGYPLSDWYPFFWSLDAILIVLVAVSIGVYIEDAPKPINKNRFLR